MTISINDVMSTHICLPTCRVKIYNINMSYLLFITRVLHVVEIEFFTWASIKILKSPNVYRFRSCFIVGKIANNLFRVYLLHNLNTSMFIIIYKHDNNIVIANNNLCLNKHMLPTIIHGHCSYKTFESGPIVVLTNKLTIK